MAIKSPHLYQWLWVHLDRGSWDCLPRGAGWEPLIRHNNHFICDWWSASQEAGSVPHGSRGSISKDATKAWFFSSSSDDSQLRAKKYNVFSSFCSAFLWKNMNLRLQTTDKSMSLGKILFEGRVGFACEIWALIAHRTLNTQESSKTLESSVTWGGRGKESDWVHEVTLPDFPLWDFALEWAPWDESLLRRPQFPLSSLGWISLGVTKPGV